MNATRALTAAATLVLGLAACEREAPEGPAPAQADTELTFACMADDAAPAVLPGFAAEHGVKVKTLTYETPEEAAQAIRRGERRGTSLCSSRNSSPASLRKAS
jgi:spermidine/putrescine-binding protein